MAEAYLFQSSAAQYRNGNIEGCIGGGEDYKTLSKGETQHVYLFHPLDLRGYSSACYLSYYEAAFGTKYTLTTGTPGLGRFTIYVDILVYDKVPTVSGNTVEPSTGSHKVVQHYANGPISSSSSYVQCSPDRTLTEEKTVFGGINGMLGADFTLTNPGNLSCRIYLKNCRFTAKIYLACYVTFQGDGITTKKQKFEEGAVPSYGSTPTRVGYIFKGWKSGSTTYTGSLPTAGHTDVTYTAVWEEIPKYYLDLNGCIDGVLSGSISPAGTADVYINGVRVSADGGVSDYYVQHYKGSTYQIPREGIKEKKGYRYKGVKSGSLIGTLNADTSVVLEFESVPELAITDVSMTYNSKQVSTTNRVPCGGSYILSVGIETG